MAELDKGSKVAGRDRPGGRRRRSISVGGITSGAKRQAKPTNPKTARNQPPGRPAPVQGLGDRATAVYRPRVPSESARIQRFTSEHRSVDCRAGLLALPRCCCPEKPGLSGGHVTLSARFGDDAAAALVGAGSGLRASCSHHSQRPRSGSGSALMMADAVCCRPSRACRRLNT